MGKGNGMQTIHELAKANRLRTSWDESRVGREKDPWLQIIPGRHGHIYQHAPGQPAFSTNTRSRALAIMRAIPGCTVLQNGDDGINATFPLEALPDVARRLGARRRRQLSLEQLASQVARLLKHQFRAGRGPQIAPESTITIQSDLGVEQP